MKRVGRFLLALAMVGPALAVMAAALGDRFAVAAFLAGSLPPFLLWRSTRSFDAFVANLESDAHAQHD